MKASLLVLTLVIALLSLLNSWSAQAMPSCNTTVLLQCYADCKDFFIDPILRAACNSGCLIGCFTSGAA
jgi:hypothetical protein